MTQCKDAYTEHQLKRWMRPDAHRFIRPDWRHFVRPGYERDFPFELYERKYSPDQPRDYHGRWTSEGGEADSKPTPSSADGDATTGRDNGADVEELLAEAKQIVAAGGANYDYCVNKCFHLLERFQPLGSDRNQWDFHKCLNACLGR